MAGSKKKLFSPPKTFDDDAEAMAKLFAEKKWSFPNVDVKTLAADATEQRAEKAALTKAESEVDNMRKTLATKQVVRYKRFSSALAAARGAFKDDPATLALLEPFKRSATGRPKKDAQA